MKSRPGAVIVSSPAAPTLDLPRQGHGKAAGKGGNRPAGLSISATLPANDCGAATEPLDLPTDDPGRYEMTGEHARGGLGRIVNAVDRRLGRVVAIKELLEHSDAMAESFVREALVTARLQHPGIVPIHDAGRWPSGEPYYSMPLLPGRSLKEALDDVDSVSARLDLLPHALSVADTLAYAHSQGVVHRDVKPANIMIGEYGETVLIDWGLALVQERDESELDESTGTTTENGRRLAAGFASSSSGVVGTPAYMAPEQASGHMVGPTGDVYALGAVLYELLTGQAPYSGPTASATLERVKESSPTPAGELAPDMPAELIAIVGRAMARDPLDRYPSAQELASDLRRFQAGQLVVAHRYSTRALLGRWLRKNKSTVMIGGVAALAVLAIGAMSVQRVVEERNVARRERSTAQAALEEASQRRRELTLLQAKSSLNIDPTAAIAWLKEYAPRADEMAGVQALISEAQARGVAKHVVRVDEQVLRVRYSPDGQTLAFVSGDGVLHVVDLATGELRRLGKHAGCLRAMRFDHSGARIVTGGATEGATFATTSGTVRVWDVKTGDFEEFKTVGKTVGDVAFSPDGDKVLLIAARDLNLKPVAAVWDIAADKQLWSSAGDWRRLALAPNGSRVVLVDAESEVHTYEVKDGKDNYKDGEARPLGLTLDSSSSLALSENGDVLLSHAASGLVRHELTTAPATSTRIGDHAPGAGSLLVLSADERFAAAYDARNPMVVYWDLKTGKAIELHGHKDGVMQARFLPDARLVTASDDTTVRIWGLDSAARHVLSGHTDDAVSIATSPDGETFASTSMDGSVRVWPTRMGGSFAVNTKRPEWRVHRVGKTLASLAQDGTVSLWDIPTRTQRVLGKGGFAPGMMGMLLHRPVVSPDERWVAAPGTDNDVLLLSTRGNAPKHLRGLGGTVGVTSFSPDGKRVIATSSDLKAMIWNIESERGEEIADAGQVFTATFTPDGKQIALATSKGLMLRDATTGANIDTPPQLRQSAAMGIVFTPDGNTLVAVGMQQIVFWDRASDRVVVADDFRMTYSISFSPDSTKMAAACDDRRVRVWDLATGEATVLAGHTDMVFEVAFVDNDRIVSSSHDRTVRVWNLENQRSRVLWGHAGAAVGLAVLEHNQLAVADHGGAIRWWDIAERAAVMPREVAAQLPALTTARIAGERPQTPAAPSP